MGVRRESVELSLDDVDFSTGMARAAGQTALLNKQLRELDGTSVRASRSTKSVGDESEKVAQKTRRASTDLNQFTGRLSLLATAGATLGPALLPIGAVAVPAVTALTGGLGAAAGAVGVALLAFHGFGDALDALNAYQLAPTDENLQKMRQTMGELAPEAQELVTRLDRLGPVIDRLQATAGSDLFPGLNEGLSEILALTPDVNDLVSRLATEMGRLAAEGGQAVQNDADLQAFFAFVRAEAAPTLDAFARATGNVIAGLGSMLVAFRPLSRAFNLGMLDMSRSFREWAANLDDSDGFRSFVEYIRENGPQVGAFFEAVAQAVIALAEAAAPWGSFVLPILTDVAKVFATIAGSPIGPVLYSAAAAMLSLRLAAGGLDKMATSLGKVGVNAGTASTKLGSFAGRAAGILAVVGAVGALTDSMGRLKSADLDRNLESFRSGSGSHEIEQIIGNIRELDSWTNKVDLGRIFNVVGVTSTLQKFGQNVDQVDQALARMVEDGNADHAAQIWDHLIDVAHEQGVSTGELSKHFDSYKTALKNASAANDDYASSAEEATTVTSPFAEQVATLSQAMKDQRSAALGAFDAVTQYGQALADARKRAKESNAGIDASTKAGRENRQALSALAAAWNNQSDAVRNNSKKFREAKQDFINAAVAMKVPEDQARRLARQILNIPDRKAIKVSADTRQAQNDLQRIIDMAAGIHDKTVRLNYIVNQVGTTNVRRGGGRDGDPSTAYASGGWTGPGRRDEPAGIVHRDEVVLPKYVVRRDARFLRQRYGFLPGMSDLPGYAGGGVVRDPNSQLFGLGSKKWSDAEIGERISNLTVAQIRRLGRAMDDLSNRNLRHLGHALDKASELQERQTQDAEDAYQAIQSKRSGYASDISQSLTRDLFGAGGSAFSSQYAAGSIAGANAQLRAQIRDSQEFEKLEKILRGRGVSGDALNEILSGGIDRARMAAAASTTDLRNYQSLYGDAQGATLHAANYGAALLTPEFAALKDAYDQQVAESRGIRAEIRALRNESNRRHSEATRDRRRNADRTANGVHRSLNNSARSARGR